MMHQLQIQTETEVETVTDTDTLRETHVMMSLTKPKRQQSQQEQHQEGKQQNNMENLSIAKMICNKQMKTNKKIKENAKVCNMLQPPTPQTTSTSTSTTTATIIANEASTESAKSTRITQTVDGNCYCHNVLLPLHSCDSNNSNNSHSNNNKNNTKNSKEKFHYTKPRKLHHHQHQQLRQWLLITTLLLASFCDAAEAALRNVNLLVEPPAVRRGQSVLLRCDYSLDGAPLYSIKLYRGQLEFYRYTPGEYPHTKVFQYPGIKVDENASNATQVMIRNVSFGLSGNFSCEVTADAPLYSTATAYAQMQVVEFPEKRPQLFTEHTRYEPGDVLRANCSTPPSRPRADLRFSINNIPVSSEETQYIRTVDNLIASRLSLKVQLQAVHFAAASPALGNNAIGGGNTQSGSGVGALMLRCTAQIGDLYQEYKEIELGTPQKDPVPARVTLSSGSGIRNFFETYFATSGATTTTSAATTTWLVTTIISFIIINSNNFWIIGKAFQSR